MLDLNSPRWKQLKASPGGDGELAVALLRKVLNGDHSAYDELYQQVCHQFSVGEVAYAVVPHLVDMAFSAPSELKISALNIVGAVAASRIAYRNSSARIPEDLEPEYIQANCKALEITAEALKKGRWKAQQSLELIATLTALHEHADLALHLFLSGDSSEMHCPNCGEYIQFRESE